MRSGRQKILVDRDEASVDTTIDHSDGAELRQHEGKGGAQAGYLVAWVAETPEGRRWWMPAKSQGS